MTFSSSFGDISRRYPKRLGTPLKYQMCVTGAASSMWPMRSRRTEDLVTSTPQLAHFCLHIRGNIVDIERAFGIVRSNVRVEEHLIEDIAKFFANILR